MFLKMEKSNFNNENLADSIKKDLIINLKSKGINISNLIINMQPDKIYIEASMPSNISNGRHE